MTYEELSKVTNLPITVLNRYIRGHVLPSIERAHKLNKLLSKRIKLEELVKERLKFDERGYFDNTKLLGDTGLLRLIARTVASNFHGGYTKVMTAAADGIPIATHIANEFGIDLVIAKKMREVGVRRFIEETFVPSYSGVLTSLYIPDGSISSSDKVLIVDDVVRSGETQRAMIDLVKKAGGMVEGVFILVGVGDAWKNEVKLPEGKIEVLLKLPDKR